MEKFEGNLSQRDRAEIGAQIGQHLLSDHVERISFPEKNLTAATPAEVRRAIDNGHGLASTMKRDIELRKPRPILPKPEREPRPFSPPIDPEDWNAPVGYTDHFTEEQLYGEIPH